MAVELRVNGQTFQRFKQIDGTRSIDTFSGEIRIVVSQQPNNISVIKANDLIEVFLDSIQVFTGYVEKINDAESKDSHDISYVARDKVADLIDSSVPENVKNIEGVATFAEVCQLCIDGLGLSDQITVIDNVGAQFGDSSKVKAAKTGQTVGDFLQENARIVQVFLNTDGKGNVLIQRPSGKLKTTIQKVPNATNNNVLSSNVDIDLSSRFYKYTVYSNSSLASDSATVNDVNNKGESLDSEIRPTRIFEKIAEKPMTSDQCQKAADEEANIRRARSFLYKCTIVGFSANGELWEPGKEVTVKDIEKGVNGLFQINTVTWTSSRDGGETVSMDITLPDKTLVEPEPTAVDKRTTSASSTYGVQAGDTLSQISANLGVSLDDVVAANPQIEDINLIFPDQEIIIPTSGGSE